MWLMNTRAVVYPVAMAWMLLGASVAAQAQSTDTVVPPRVRTLAEVPAAPRVAALARAKGMVALRDSIDAFQRHVRALPNCDDTNKRAIIIGMYLTLPQPVRLFARDSAFVATSAPTLEDIAKATGFVKTAKSQTTDCDAGAPGAANYDAAQPVALASAGVAAFFPAQSALVRGLTDFMVTRALDEAVFSFLIHLEDAVEKEKLVTVGMPRSWRLMTQLEAGTYQTLLPSVRTAFAQDLNDLPRHVNSPAMRQEMGWDSPPTYVQTLAVAFQRGAEIRNGVHPLTAVQNLLEVSEDELGNDTVRAVVHIVGLAAREYAIGGGKSLIQELTRSDNGGLRHYFVAFVVHDAVVLDDFDDHKATVLKRAAEAEDQMIHLLQQVNTLAETMASLEGVTGKPAAEIAERALLGIGSMLQVVNTGRRFLPLVVDTETQVFDDVVEDALMLHQAIVARDFTQVVTWLTSRDFFKQHIGRDVLQYLALAGSLASAQDADDVTTALRTAAVPVGSYRAKRYQRPTDGTSNSSWRDYLKPQSFSVVGYLGARVGTEGTGDNPVFKGDSHFAGVALPVGVEFSTGIFPLGALSIFAPILDLGTVASARWGGSDNTDTNPEVGFEQVFAPGLFLVLNIGGVPLSIGAGVQAVPNLRREEGTDRQIDVVRSSVFIGVDAPLFHFRLP